MGINHGNCSQPCNATSLPLPPAEPVCHTAVEGEDCYGAWRGRWTRVSFPTQTGTLTLHQVRPSKTSRLGCTASATATVQCHAPWFRQHLLVSCRSLIL